MYSETRGDDKRLHTIVAFLFFWKPISPYYGPISNSQWYFDKSVDFSFSVVLVRQNRLFGLEKSFQTCNLKCFFVWQFLIRLKFGAGLDLKNN